MRAPIVLSRGAHSRQGGCRPVAIRGLVVHDPDCLGLVVIVQVSSWVIAPGEAVRDQF